MPNWKKIIVSGSSAALSSLTVTNNVTATSFTGSFTGNLQGTSSWATNAISSSHALTSISASHAISASYALTASYVNPLIQNVIITGSLFVTQSHISTVDYIDYTLLTTVPVHAEGRVHWLDDTKTLQIDTDVSNFSVEVGHQNVVRVRNTTGYNLAIGKIVYINGESGNRPTVTTASWDGDPTSATTLGFVAQQINDNQTGYVVTNGMLRGINTSTYSPGTQLYLSSSGDFTSTIPLSPKHEVRLGKIVTQAVNGTIYVDIMNGYEIGELHDVLVVSSSAGDLLVKSGSLWINTKQLTGSYGLTGSLQATSFTGSLLGTSSYSVQALSSSFAQTASFAPNYVLTSVTSSMLAPYVLTSQTSSMSVASASVATSASYALTASFALNGGGGTTNTGSLLTTASVSLNTITFTKGDGSTFPITVDTGSGGGGGAAFPYTGSAIISGSLTVTGSANVQGAIGISRALIERAEITISASGLYTIYSAPTSSYRGIFADYTLISTNPAGNARAGNIMSVLSGSQVRYAETRTSDIGNTAAAAVQVSLSGGNLNLELNVATVATTWNLVSLVRTI